MTEIQDEPQAHLQTYSDVSARTGIPVSTLYSMVRELRIPHVRLGPRIVRFQPEVLEAWIVENAVKSGGAP